MEWEADGVEAGADAVASVIAAMAQLPGQPMILGFGRLFNYWVQSHFDSHLYHDDFARTLDASRAKLFYVPVYLNQRFTWGAQLGDPMRRALHWLRHAHPHWNASGGRDHVWFVFGERQTCLVPPEVAKASIVIGHWGDLECVDATKDIIVPTITPIQHDLPRYQQRLQPAMRKHLSDAERPRAANALLAEQSIEE